MATITVNESITLDGVVQGLGRPGEDTRGGFEHSGWGPPYADDIAMGVVRPMMAETTAMLFGRWTYVDLLDAWAGRTDPNPFSDYLRDIPKYVCTRDPGFVAHHPNTEVLLGEACDTVPAATAQLEGAVSVLGSGELVRSLHAVGLVDTYVLNIHPIVMGSGRQLFAPGPRRDLHLDRAITTTTGVIIGIFHPTERASTA